jgi:hypothetical protein
MNPIDRLAKTDEEYFDRTQGVQGTERVPKNTPGTYFIALSGKKQCGKNTAAEIIQRLLGPYNMSSEVVAFADIIKDISINILGFDRDLVYGSDEDKNTMTHIRWDNFPMEIRLRYSRDKPSLVADLTQRTPRSGNMTIREVLQVMGTDVFRQMFFQDIWAQAPFRKQYSQDVVLLADCRFPNEKEATEGNGGIVIRLERDTGMIDKHPSETALDGYQFDYSFNNNGTLEELENFLKSVLRDVGLL